MHYKVNAYELKTNQINIMVEDDFIFCTLAHRLTRQS